MSQDANQQKLYKLSCHCGGVEIEFHSSYDIQNPTSCNCSLCRRRGAKMIFVDASNLKITKGQEILTLYQFNTHTAKHYFCSVCGIYTHHQRRFNSNQFAINIGCIDGVDPNSYKEITIFDGENHPLDKIP